ncbi:MAG: hypothetical protein Q8S11_02920 [Daejeonella sp.]|uniref:hypothetical protein n=1 Tax=Daejeonella sp. TaxID=2805397 RepID=UPI0027351577|nr:hypothetical protein [Daejeonella sp.]MDP3467258.1 hypothetical protein [Daejeonella sp.]
MATTKASRTKASDTRATGSRSARIAKALKGGWIHGIANAAPYNTRSMTERDPYEVSTVIVLKVNSSLDKIAAGPLNAKALEAKNMFAKYRKNH